MTTSPINPAGRSLTLVGLGNILSQAVSHVGRLPCLRRVALVDPDTYENKNRVSQEILPGDVGKTKVEVQARRLREINPHLEIETFAGRVEDVPLAALSADVLLAGVDSRKARQAVNQAAWRLGRPWVDTGVGADGMLARVNVYEPSPESPCLECAWSNEDYAAIEQEYLCRPGSGQAAATNAPTMLGALAASLAVIECVKLLSGEREHALCGRQVLIDARHHRH
ncbi:MAG: ThiF family adenylyltransferase, partial [Planctomycetaceae bacterium]